MRFLYELMEDLCSNSVIMIIEIILINLIFSSYDPMAIISPLPENYTVFIPKA